MRASKAAGAIEALTPCDTTTSVYTNYPHTRLAYSLTGRTAEAGALLAEVRSQCKRGAWGAFLAHAGIGRRRAQRAMARNGVRRNATPEIDYLADFGMTLAALAASIDVSPSTMRRAIFESEAGGIDGS